MGEAAYSAAPPPERPKTVIAALGPRMLALAAELADGAHPYNVTPEHTAQARKALGSGKLLCVEQAAILESDAGKARALARQFLAIYLGLPNYYNNWNRLGFTDVDRENGGSDRLIDALIVWGDEKTIRARLDAHVQAGADHVCVQPSRCPTKSFWLYWHRARDVARCLPPGTRRWSEPPNLDRPTRLFLEVLLGGLGDVVDLVLCQNPADL